MPNKKKNQKHADSPWIVKNVLASFDFAESVNYLRCLDNISGSMQVDFEDWRKGVLNDREFIYKMALHEQSFARMMIGLESELLKPYKERLK